MKKNRILLMLIVLALIFACKQEQKVDVAEKAEITKEVVVEKEKTIFEKLGGAEGVSLLVDDIVAKHLENENIKKYFEPVKNNPEHFKMFKNNVKDFLSAGTGGDVEYKGRDMQNAHAHLNISERDFLDAIDDILFVLDKHKVDRASRNELLATLYSMKDAVIAQN